MRILVINHYAGSYHHGMEYRPFQFGREWVRNGHSVVVFAAAYSHLRHTQPGKTTGHFGRPYCENMDGIEYWWYHTNAYLGNGFGRFINILLFLLGVGIYGPRVARTQLPDIVVASSTYPMDIWIAKRIAKKCGSRLVFELHDLWPLTLTEVGGMASTHPFVRLCALAEKSIYQNSDAIVSILPAVDAYVKDKGYPLDRLYKIPNGIEMDGTVPSSLQKSLRELISSKKKDARLLVGYAGAHGLPNALETLLDIAQNLADDGVQFILVGDGSQKENLISEVRRRDLCNVSFHAGIPKTQVRSFLQAMDVLYIGWKPRPIYEYGISPNKLLDYMVSGRPIVHAVSAANDLVQDADCGLSFHPEDVSGIVSGLRRMAEMDTGPRLEMGAAGKRYVMANYTISMLAHKYIKILESL